MIYDLIALWSIPFFVLIGLSWAIITYALENEDGSVAFADTIISAIILVAFTDLNIFQWVFHHLWEILVYTIMYAVAGAVWSVVKWWFYVLNKLDDSKAVRKEYERHKSLAKEHAIDLKTFMADRGYPPRASRHRGLICLWIAYWPMSAVWTLLNDPVKRISAFVYSLMEKLYQSVSDRIFSGVFDE